MTNNSIEKLLSSNTYPGRGIIIGKTADGARAVAAYFIMGRSENSRNRVFRENGGDVTIYPFDESKVSDPSLIIYSPIRPLDNNLIVTNGDQTDTIYVFMTEGKTFEQALETREYEPDAPNYTPRVSGMLTFDGGDFTYKMSILKCADGKGGGCNRFTFSYSPVCGTGHFIHTYICDGSPIPSFEGEPEPISIPNDVASFADAIWNSLNGSNKVSLCVRDVELSTGKVTNRIFNKNK